MNRLLAQGLECSICLDIVSQAVITPCEHLFCRECIVVSLGSDTGACPTCCASVNIAQVRS